MIPLYKEDCKWYDFWQDMGARIPFCKAGENMDASGFYLETCDGCKDYSNKNVITNSDRFRAKSDEELAKTISGDQIYPWCTEEPCKYDSCTDCVLAWLKKEADT